MIYGLLGPFLETPPLVLNTKSYVFPSFYRMIFCKLLTRLKGFSPKPLALRLISIRGHKDTIYKGCEKYLVILRIAK